MREHYLRDDIWCGSVVCEECQHLEHDQILSEAREHENEKYNYHHYLILDTNIVLNQIDVLEEDVIHNVIVLQTVLNEVKHRSGSTYKRLKDLIGNPARRFHVFVNEHHM